MLGLTELMFLFTSAMAGVPFLLAHEWATAPLETPHRSSSQASPSQAWMSGPGAREAFAAGGVRALLDRSSMRYDAAIYLGGAP
jgi:hypothetical protein